MIPPCDPAILDANPHFKALHRQLTTTILNPDATTRALSEDANRKEAQRELRELQIREAKRNILRRVLEQVAYSENSTNGLPDELRELVIVIALYLQQPDSNSGCNGDAQDEVFSLLASDIDAFLSYLPALTPAISNILASDLAHLKALVGTPSASLSTASEGPASSVSRFHSRHGRRAASTSASPRSISSIPSLSAHLSDRLDTLRDAQLTKLPTAQRQVADTAAAVLAAQTKVMERTIHILERTKHGALARAEKARAEHLAKVAEELHSRVNIMRREVLSAIYSPETTVALTRYRDHLQDTRFRLEERQQNALRELATYEAADDESGEGSGTMLEISKSYGDLVEEVEALREEIEKLSSHV
ncbi:hypothetical protein VTO42DRAFT_5004 [Malbranchea cinnamomea]